MPAIGGSGNEPTGENFLSLVQAQIGTPYVLSEAEQAACRSRLGTPSLYRKAWDHFRTRITSA